MGECVDLVYVIGVVGDEKVYGFVNGGVGCVVVEDDVYVEGLEVYFVVGCLWVGDEVGCCVFVVELVVEGGIVVVGVVLVD